MEKAFPIVFPFFFFGMWLSITTLLAYLSRWFVLARRYPDREAEIPLFQQRLPQAWMGTVGVNYRGCLNVAACPGGLRVWVMRLFGPFCRPFFVSWDEIQIERRQTLWMEQAVLTFGKDRAGTLGIPAAMADRIWREVPDQWPEAGKPPVELPRLQRLGRGLVRGAVASLVVFCMFGFMAVMFHNAPQGPPLFVFAPPACIAAVVTFVAVTLQR